MWVKPQSHDQAYDVSNNLKLWSWSSLGNPMGKINNVDIWLKFQAVRNTIDYKSIPQLVSAQESYNDAIRLTGGTPFRDFEHFRDTFLIPKKNIVSFTPGVSLNRWLGAGDKPVFLCTGVALSAFDPKKIALDAGIAAQKIFPLDEVNWIWVRVEWWWLYDFGMKWWTALVKTLAAPRERKENLEWFLEWDYLGEPFAFRIWAELFYARIIGEDIIVKWFIWYNYGLTENDIWLNQATNFNMWARASF